MSLNELTDELERSIAPTDSRFRSDIRLLEQGDIGQCLYRFEKAYFLHDLLIIGLDYGLTFISL